MTQKLSPELLISAYSQGFFPMPHPETAEILWFHPDPRAILPLDGFHCSRSLQRSLKKSGFRYTLNQAFREVMKACADRRETWINDEFLKVYTQLHQLGFAHSLEVWQGEQLVGGTYGVCLGGAFFAESKFHRVSDASKAALYYLTEHLRHKGYVLLEVQFLTAHLKTLGVIEISAADYEVRLKAALKLRPQFLI